MVTPKMKKARGPSEIWSTGKPLFWMSHLHTANYFKHREIVGNAARHPVQIYAHTHKSSRSFSVMHIAVRGKLPTEEKIHQTIETA